ncbi:MAG TPA: hypothetical protein VNE40_04825 [Candidatus Dormibacteraeota bacterium]|nr:hypothetical protein [Candidatus Dormibacteraeota bacterium]
MFGHQDNQQDEHQGGPVPEPPADGILTHDNESASVDSSPPASHTNPALPLNDHQFGSTSDVDPFTDDNGPVTASAVLPPSANDLLDIKQQALQQLTPLVGHLEQTPEEKFRTTMMMIQAADNQSLLKTAYETAQKITDEKARAQALLDIVNEINYFTHSQNDQA